MNILIVDTETTGLDPEVDRVVELAGVRLTMNSGGPARDSQYSCLVDPGRPIPPEASAVHHLTDEMVVGANSLYESWHEMTSQIGDPEVFVAHNAPFDLGFLSGVMGTRLPVADLGEPVPPSLPRPPLVIDTCQCARHLYPDAPGYGNMVLRYYLGIHHYHQTPPRLSPHRALFDALCTERLLCRMIDGADVPELVRLSTTPVLQKTCRFGKHKNLPWSAVPKDYLRFVLRCSDPPFDANVRHTAEYHLRASGTVSR